MGLLEGKVALITGASRGIGKAIALKFASEGADIAFTDIQINEDTVRELEAFGGKVRAYASNAADFAQTHQTVEQILADFGHIDILVNSQGVNKKFPALEFPMDIFDSVMHDDVASILMTCKHFGKYMKENGYGKIVNVSSVRGRSATKGPGNAAYCAAKGAVDLLTKQLASEFGPFGITVNAFGPNIMKTPMMTKVFEMRAKEAGITVDLYLANQAAILPMSRMSDPDDCVGTALFLAAPASDFLTGNLLYPDGGLTAIG